MWCWFSHFQFFFCFFTSNRLFMRQFWCYVFDATALKILKGFHFFQVTANSLLMRRSRIIPSWSFPHAIAATIGGKTWNRLTKLWGKKMLVANPVRFWTLGCQRLANESVQRPNKAKRKPELLGNMWTLTWARWIEKTYIYMCVCVISWRDLDGIWWNELDASMRWAVWVARFEW